MLWNTQKKMKILAKCALFGAAIIWGSSFFVVKNTVDIFTPHMLLGFRFTIGCILLAVIFRKKLKLLDKGYFISGAVIGFCLFAAYSLQTIGITDTTPGKNAFLTAIYCIIVPFLFWAVDKSKPDIYNYLAAIICNCGHWPSLPDRGLYHWFWRCLYSAGRAVFCGAHGRRCQAGP